MIEQGNLCPACNKLGNEVKNTTVNHIIIEDKRKQVGKENYYLCMNEECEIVYYNLKLDIRFNKEDVNVPIWLKKDADPKYVCYCNKVTEKQVIDSVVNDGAREMKDIIKLTSAMKNGQCETQNPLGQCCHSVVQDAIDKGLSVTDN